MAEYQITCVRQVNNVIKEVGIDGKSYLVQTVISWIKNGKYTFYTIKSGRKAPVYVKKSMYGTEFLTTEPDSTRENNLDFLGECPYSMPRG